MEHKEVKRGEVFYADLCSVVGSEQGGVRPVLIVQNDVGNRHSPTVIAAAITSKQDKTNLPTHIGIKAGTGGLTRDSVVLLEQVRTLDKRRLRERAGQIDPDVRAVWTRRWKSASGLNSRAARPLADALSDIFRQSQNLVNTQSICGVFCLGICKNLPAHSNSELRGIALDLSDRTAAGVQHAGRRFPQNCKARPRWDSRGAPYASQATIFFAAL